MRKLALVAVLVAATVANVGIHFAPTSNPKPTDVTTLTNDELLAQLDAQTVSTSKVCVAPDHGNRFTQLPLESVAFADETHGRVVIVCTPTIATGPAQ